MKKKIIALILILLIIGLGIFFYKTNKKDTSNELTLYGNIEIRQVDLSFLAGGQVSKLLKEEGDTVKKGELIATLDSRDYEANYNKAIADVERTFVLKNDALEKYNIDIPVLGVMSGMDATKNITSNTAYKYYDLVMSTEKYHKNKLVTFYGIDINPVYESKCIPYLKANDLFYIVAR